MKTKYLLTAVIWKEGRRYVSKCPELGVSSFGRTPETAQKALEEAVSLYIENASRLGFLKEIRPILTSTFHYTAPLEIAVA